MLSLGLILAVALNIDSIHVARTLWEQPALSKEIAGQATTFVEKCKTPGNTKPTPSEANTAPADAQTALAPECLHQDIGAIRDLIADTLPIGWRSVGWNPWALLGWVITAFAISLGAQFWFDLLTKFINLRAAGPKPERANASQTPDVSKTP
jgi:hypothetical protein